MPVIRPPDLIRSRKMFYTWEDIVMPAQELQPDPASSPTWNATDIGWEFDDAPVANEEVGGIAEMPHRWVEHSALIFHIHWRLLNAGAAGEDVKWDIFYRHADIGSAWAGFVNQAVLVDVSAVGASEHIYTTWANPVHWWVGISGIWDIRLQRDTADATDDHPHPVLLKSIDIAYQADSFGSHTELAKWG